MSIVRTAIPLVLLTSVLTGCAGLQKTDWPKCAAVGGVGGAALGAIESSSWAGWGALLGGGLAAGYC
ncbi:MAG: OmpA family protein, partial [Pseudomonas alloputida]